MNEILSPVRTALGQKDAGHPGDRGLMAVTESGGAGGGRKDLRGGSGTGRRELGEPVRGKEGLRGGAAADPSWPGERIIFSRDDFRAYPARVTAKLEPDEQQAKPRFASCCPSRSRGACQWLPALLPPSPTETGVRVCARKHTEFTSKVAVSQRNSSLNAGPDLLQKHRGKGPLGHLGVRSWVPGNQAFLGSGEWGGGLLRVVSGQSCEKVGLIR